MKLNRMLAVLLMGLPGAAGAQQAARQEAHELGAEVRAWTELQISGAAASGSTEPLPGEVADRVYTRYLESFTRPIPERFERDAFNPDSE